MSQREGTNANMKPSGTTTLLEAALAYRARGWSIIPVQGKRAAVPWKRYQVQPAKEKTVRRWFEDPSVTGVAVLFGPSSAGLACRDYDLADAYHVWAKLHPDLAQQLPTVQTRRGFHVYSRGPEGFENLGDGEYRADAGHYCLLPPSQHPNSGTYRWVVPLPEGELPTADPVRDGLLSSVQQSRHSQPSQMMPFGGSVLGIDPSARALMPDDKAVEDAMLDTLPAAPGQRNRKLWDLARRLKAIPHLVNATPQRLRPIVARWHQHALPLICTKPLEETLYEFYRAWDRSKYPFGTG